MSRSLPTPSPAMVVACLALVVALGGTSYAALVNVPRRAPPQYQRRSSPRGAPTAVAAVDAALTELRTQSAATAITGRKPLRATALTR